MRSGPSYSNQAQLLSPTEGAPANRIERENGRAVAAESVTERGINHSPTVIDSSGPGGPPSLHLPLQELIDFTVAISVVQEHRVLLIQRRNGSGHAVLFECTIAADRPVKSCRIYP